jgi:F0F1-type ATP synthase membrane subunit c/vacuolar-type H+-ATPase subunit K
MRMPDAPPMPTPARRLRQLQITWAAFLLVVAFYTPIPFLLGSSAPAPPPVLRTGLIFAGLGAAVAAFGTKRWWSNSLLAALQRGGEGDDAWARLRAGCIITWALSETVALIGMAVAIAGRRPTDVLPFSAAAALLLYFHRLSTWPLDALARAEGRPA